ncbi:MAG: carbohydrate ABC transporter permease [Armatimonadota bacterium]
MKDRPSPGSIAARALVLLGAFGTLLPFWWMVSTALQSPAGVFQQPPEWFPEDPRWSNFVRVTQVVPFWRGLLNTLILTVPPLVGGLLASALAAYAFARLRFPGRDGLFGALLATMMIPGAVTLIPLFVFFRELQWVDTFRPLIVPGLFGGAYAVFFMRQYFRTLPPDLDEAARIDGCNPLQSFWKINLPLAHAPLATLGVFGFLGGWNDFMGPLIYLNSPERFPLQLVLAEFQSLYYTDWSLIMASATLASLPVILLYLAAQRYVVEGIAATGLKG